MSCGRPLIVSKNRGLWGKDLLRDGENCLLVPPGDADALGRAVDRVRRTPALANELGQAARATVLEHFGLAQLGTASLALARLGLGLWTGRSSQPSDAV